MFYTLQMNMTWLWLEIALSQKIFFPLIPEWVSSLCIIFLKAVLDSGDWTDRCTVIFLNIHF